MQEFTGGGAVAEEPSMAFSGGETWELELLCFNILFPQKLT
jgi:hypothetical protein